MPTFELDLTQRFAFWRRLRPRSSNVGIKTSVDHLRRSESLRVDITVRNRASSEKRLRVGLVCIERYDVEESSHDSTGDVTRYDTRRVTREAVASEQWSEVDVAEAQQGLTFTVPPDAPYSYQGSCLSFEWRAEACEVARLRPDPVASCPVEVRP